MLNGGLVRLFGKTDWILQNLRKQVGLVSHDLQQSYRKGVCGLEVVLSGFCSSVGLQGVPHSLTQDQMDVAQNVMTQIGIQTLEHTPLSQMSTGQQRRCLLARALVHEPKTLILDEPTAGLDLQAAVNYLKIMRELSQKHHNLILVTHHINEIPPEIQRIVMLKHGKIVADGDKSELLNSQTLSDVFEVRLKVIQSNGFFLAHPRY